MTTELEKALARELEEVAGAIQVPPMPSVVPAEEPRTRVDRLWQPMLVAAAVLLIVCAVAFIQSHQGSRTPQPAPAPSPKVTQDATVSVTAPTVPYILDQHLYVHGEKVPGTWAIVESRGEVWLALKADGSWWSGGRGLDTGRIDAQIDQPPVLSPNGRYAAFVDLADGRAHLTGFDTRPGGKGLGLAPIDLPSSEDGIPIAVRAVTDDGDVIVQGTRTSLMWRARYQDQQTVVDLSATAPGQVVLQGTAAGLVVVDGTDGAVDASSTAPYLASISADGRLNRGATLPTYDDLDISSDGTWLVRSPAGTLGGEVTSTTTLNAQKVGGGDEVVLKAPAGGGFASGTWTWEDEHTLLSVLLPEGAAQQPELVRCSVPRAHCRVIPGPAVSDAK